MIVEDGTGLDNSTSYVTITEASAYYARIGFTAWESLTTEQQEILLEDSSSYCDLRWGDKLKGRLLSTEQALQFPRGDIYDRYGRKIEGVPSDWKKSVMEYAVQASSGTLISQTSSADDGLTAKTVTVGPITTSRTWNTPVSSSGFKTFPKADALAKQFTYITSGSRTVR